MVNGNHKTDQVKMGKYVIEHEFVIAGGVGGISVGFTKSDDNKAGHVGILSLDEITFDKVGKPLYHRLNGDEASAIIDDGEVRAFKIKMYEY